MASADVTSERAASKTNSRKGFIPLSFLRIHLWMSVASQAEVIDA
jgi:hypothetical protein